MDEAISELSIKCDPAEASRALYLLSAPSKEMNMDLVKELGNYMKDVAPKAIVRNGDYPREKSSLDVAVILSELSDVQKIRNYYEKTTEFMYEFKGKRDRLKKDLKKLDESGKDIPTLL